MSNDFIPPPPAGEPPVDQKVTRQDKNRMSAQRSRDKKKAYLERLEQSFAQLKQEKESDQILFKKMVGRLYEEIERLTADKKNALEELKRIRILLEEERKSRLENPFLETGCRKCDKTSGRPISPVVKFDEIKDIYFDDEKNDIISSKQTQTVKNKKIVKGKFHKQKENPDFREESDRNAENSVLKKCSGEDFYKESFLCGVEKVDKDSSGGGEVIGKGPKEKEMERLEVEGEENSEGSDQPAALSGDKFPQSDFFRFFLLRLLATLIVPNTTSLLQGAIPRFLEKEIQSLEILVEKTISPNFFKQNFFRVGMKRSRVSDFAFD